MVTLQSHGGRTRSRAPWATPEPLRALLVLLVSMFLALSVMLGLTSLLSPWS